jgi:hypothetical protein
MSLLIVGTLAFDDIETPAGRAANEIGGSAAYAAVAASFSTPTRVVAIVGQDFPGETLSALERRGIDLAGVVHGDGPSFRWACRYHENLNVRDTLDTQLNVLTQFPPRAPAGLSRQRGRVSSPTSIRCSSCRCSTSSVVRAWSLATR